MMEFHKNECGVILYICIFCRWNGSSKEYNNLAYFLVWQKSALKKVFTNNEEWANCYKNTWKKHRHTPNALYNEALDDKSLKNVTKQVRFEFNKLLIYIHYTVEYIVYYYLMDLIWEWNIQQLLTFNAFHTDSKLFKGSLIIPFISQFTVLLMNWLLITINCYDFACNFE